MSDGWSDDEATTSAPAPVSGGFGDDGDGGDKPKDDTCRKCKQPGHMARDCELPDTCRKCGEEGHMARDCEKPDTCRRCGAEGHKVAECTEEEKTRKIIGEDGTEREIYVPVETSDADLFSKESTISSGINFAKYADIKVDVSGENVPPPINTFKEARLRQLVQDNVEKAGYKIPTPIQKHSIPIVLEKRDVLACAQTGSGKTAAFLLPIISSLLESGADSHSGDSCQSPKAIIITPTRELAIQIQEQSRKFAMGSMIRTCLAYGGTSSGAQFNAMVRNGCHILVGTPGRINDFLEKGKINLSEIEYFILDEADRMLDMGFGPDIAKVANHHSMTKKEDRTTLLFSATFPKDVRVSANNYLRKDRVFISVGVIGAPCADISQTFIAVDRNGKKGALLDILNDENRDPAEKIMIFVNTKRQADFLACLLSQLKKPSTSIHGDRLQREREEALRDFRSGNRPIIVCTAVAARGLDIPEVQHVVNYDMPKDVDEYVHRVGRTGRVGNLGRATSFYDAAGDGDVRGPLVQLLQEAGVELPGFMTGDDMDGFGDSGSAPVGGGGAAAAADDDDW
eukprot:TRINITY_DN1034_c0_g1_i10.p1 TRINITY_DN1034_c0_g1~~TRINITY_DN1034_c0_g1_i10.p1  ORF type:complete len:569 (-),score=165.91 TRINITY_DN1034_c0_g1_i10:678-2384(-)